MRISFKIREFTFYLPQEISESSFNSFKIEFINNNKLSLNTNDNFIQTFKIELIFLGVLIFGALMANSNIEWISTIGGFIILGTIWGFFEFIVSIFPYVDYLVRKRRYYNRLKIDIIKVETYQDFISIRSLSRK